MEIPIANLDVKLQEEMPAENERMSEGYKIAKNYYYFI